MAAYIVLTYGVLVVAGGIMGYVKSKSLPSILAGGISGVLIIISSILMMNQSSAGSFLALALSVMLLIMFGLRFQSSKKLMPSGLMIILSLISLVTLLLHLRN